MKTIIFILGGGRFANQLLNYAHLLSFALENPNKYQIVNIPFWDYEDLFKSLDTDQYETFTDKRYSLFIIFLRYVHGKLLGKPYKLVRYILTIAFCFILHHSENAESIITGMERIVQKLSGLKVDELRLDDPSSVHLFAQSHTILLAGWGIRCWSYLEKHQEEVKKQLSFSDSIYQEAWAQIDSLRNKYDFLIGFHIRQGDYRDYKNGLYFFDSQRYLDWIKEAREFYSSKGRVGILVTSDEVQDDPIFDLDFVEFSKGSAGMGHYSVSIVQLSLCDLIIGPPSTFSLWSAFLGNSPLLVLSSPDQKLSSTQIMSKNFFDAIQHKDLFSI